MRLSPAANSRMCGELENVSKMICCGQLIVTEGRERDNDSVLIRRSSISADDYARASHNFEAPCPKAYDGL